MSLPSNHPVVQPIVWETHDHLLHSGVNTTLTALRERLWVIRTVNRIVRECFDLQTTEGATTRTTRITRVTRETSFRRPSFHAYRCRLSLDNREGWNVRRCQSIYMFVYMRLEQSSSPRTYKTTNYRCLSFSLPSKGFTNSLESSDNAKTFKSASKDIVQKERAKEVLDHMTNSGVTCKFICGENCMVRRFFGTLDSNRQAHAHESNWTELAEFWRVRHVANRSWKRRWC